MGRSEKPNWKDVKPVGEPDLSEKIEKEIRRNDSFRRAGEKRGNVRRMHRRKIRKNFCQGGGRDLIPEPVRGVTRERGGFKWTAGGRIRCKVREKQGPKRITTRGRAGGKDAIEGGGGDNCRRQMRSRRKRTKGPVQRCFLKVSFRFKRGVAH